MEILFIAIWNNLVTVQRMKHEWFGGMLEEKICQMTVATKIVSEFLKGNLFWVHLSLSLLTWHFNHYDLWRKGLSPFLELSLAEILTSNSVGAKLFFLGCNQDNNHGSTFTMADSVAVSKRSISMFVIILLKIASSMEKSALSTKAPMTCEPIILPSRYKARSYQI